MSGRRLAQVAGAAVLVAGSAGLVAGGDVAGAAAGTSASKTIAGARTVSAGASLTGGASGGAVDYWKVGLAGADQLQVTVAPAAATSNYFHVELWNVGTTDTTFPAHPPVTGVATNNIGGPDTLTLWAPYTGVFVLAICEGYGVTDCRGGNGGYDPVDPMSAYAAGTSLAGGGVSVADAAGERAPSGTIAGATALTVGNLEAGGGLAPVSFWKVHLVGGDQDQLTLTAQDPVYFHVEMYPAATTDATFAHTAPFDFGSTNSTPGPVGITVEAPYTGTFLLAICEGYGVSSCGPTSTSYPALAPMVPFAFTQTLLGGGITPSVAAGEVRAGVDIAAAPSLKLRQLEAGGSQPVDFWHLYLAAGQHVTVTVTPSLSNYFQFDLLSPSTKDATFTKVAPLAIAGTNNIGSTSAVSVTAPTKGDFTLAVCQGYGVADCAGVVANGEGTNPMSPYTFTLTP